MKNKITFYKNNGELDHEEILNEDNLAHTNGMLLKCYLNDGIEVIGYGDPYRTHDKNSYDGSVHDYINLWTWDNLDEEKHQLVGDSETKYNQTFKKIDINSINTIDAMLYSSQRWGGKFTNKFEFHKPEDKITDLEIPSFLKGYIKNNEEDE